MQTYEIEVPSVTFIVEGIHEDEAMSVVGDMLEDIASDWATPRSWRVS